MVAEWCKGLWYVGSQTLMPPKMSGHSGANPGDWIASIDDKFTIIQDKHFLETYSELSTDQKLKSLFERLKKHRIFGKLIEHMYITPSVSDSEIQNLINLREEMNNLC